MRVKRLAAGVAAAALGMAGLTLVTAPAAQASNLPVAYCSGGNNGASGGDPGVPGDPTSVSTNCSTVGGPGVAVTINLSALLGVDDTAISGLPAGTRPGWVGLTTSAGTLASGAPAASQVINADADAGWFAAPTSGVDVNEAISLDDTGVTLLVGSAPQVITVSVATSTSATFAGITTLNTTIQAPITVTVTGAPSSVQVFPAYEVKAAGQDDSVAVGLVQVFDSAGAAIPITAGDVAIGQVGGSVNDILALAADCGVSATGDDTFAPGAQAGLNTANLQSGTEACAALNANGTGVWLRATGIETAGAKNVEVVVTVGGSTYTGSLTYLVASSLGGALSTTFDKESYVPGERAVVTWCANDLSGSPVADALGWANAPVRNVNLVNNGGIAGLTAVTTPLNTYGGCASAAFFMPATPMVFTLTTTPLASAGGWADAAVGVRSIASAVVGSPEPSTPTILIVGERGRGADASRVFVEGTTTNLTGDAVTPFFRFPGQTGFTAGTGSRTVDAEGNFTWQRKTGKQIAVQFRAGDVRSNTVIISAK